MKRTLLIFAIVIVAGAGAGWGARLIVQRLNVSASIEDETPYIKRVQGQITKTGEEFFMTPTDTTKPAFEIASTSPSLDLNYYVDTMVTISGFPDPNNVFGVISVYTK